MTQTVKPDSQSPADMQGPPPPPNDNPGRLVDAFMIISLVIGLSLMAGSKMLGFYTAAESRLILVMGLGIVLGALGSAAMIQYRTWVITGGAAIGLILGWFLSHTSGSNYAIVQLKKLPPEATATLFDTEEFYRAQTTRAHEFIVLPDQVKAKTFQAEIAIGDDNPMMFGCIPSEAVHDAMGTGEPVSWNYHLAEAGQRARLLDDDTKVIAEEGPCTVASLSEPPKSSWRDVFAMVAFAADQSTGELLDALRSKSSFVRRSARSGLAQRGPAAIPEMMQALTSRSDYRTQLGVLVAASDMLNADPSLRNSIGQSMDDVQLQRLADLAGHRDATMRSYAVSILNQMEDPRVAEAVAGSLARAAPEAEADLLVSLKEQLSDSQSPQGNSAVTQAVRSFQVTRASRPQSETQTALIEQIEQAATGNKAAADMVFVQLGAFTDEDKARAFAAKLNESQSLAKISVTQKRPNDPLVRVVAGHYQPRSEAEALRNRLVEERIVEDAFLSSFPDVIAQ
ncbi:MAG: SPOR domain-containing protein [Ahrensia sp.]|nr:SPOR domain-containing protein [Ahrensia sp.]